MSLDDTQESAPETAETPVVEETPEPEIDPAPEPEPATDWEAEARRLQAELGKAKRQATKATKAATVPKETLDVSDYIDISTSLDGLDPREKQRLAEEHKATGKPLKEIRESEDFQLWQSAWRTKLEKEAALKPSSTQAVEPPPKTVSQRLQDASLAEKEQILKELGLYKEARPKADRVNIGKTLSR